MLLKDSRHFIHIYNAAAFTALKTAATQAPVLTLPDSSIPLTLVTDASQRAIGAALMQDTALLRCSAPPPKHP